MAVLPHTPPGTRRGGTATGCPVARPSRRELMAAAGMTALAGIAGISFAKPDPEPVQVVPTASRWPTQAEAAANLALCRDQDEADFIGYIRAASKDELGDILRLMGRLARGDDMRAAGAEYLQTRGYSDAEARRLADDVVRGGAA